MTQPLKRLLFISFGLALFGSCIVHMPLRVGLQISGASPDDLPVAAINGTLWSGELRRLQIAGQTIDSAQTRLLLPALLSQTPLVVRVRDRFARGSMRLGLAGRNLRLRDLTFDLPQLQAGEVTGQMSITGASIDMVGARCKAASGAAAVRLGRGGAARAGVLDCRDGLLVARFATGNAATPPFELSLDIQTGSINMRATQ